MSWSINLKTDRKIPRRSVETALTKMTVPFSTQEWGWSSTVDVNLPRGRTLQISGADFSEADAYDFASRLASILRRLHFRIAVGKLES